MAFSILSKRMLENDDIKKIVNQIKNYSSIFTLDQINNFGIDLDPSTRITLKDYDIGRNAGACYRIGMKVAGDELYDYAQVLPIIHYEEIKNDSQIISEDESAFEIQFGRGLTSQIASSDDLQKINIDLMMGNIVETDHKITILLSSDGKKTQLRVFKDQQTEKEYVFMK